MIRIILLSILAFTVIGCDQMDRRSSTQNRDIAQNSQTYAPDNTGRNQRDQEGWGDQKGSTLTAGDQSEAERDRQITAKIRQALMRDDSLSMKAKNIKIITRNGKVTLRGPVASQEEKAAIARKASGVVDVSNVDNQLEVTELN